MTYIIAVEGNIGVGKTTFINLLKERCKEIKLYNIIFLTEPIDEWNKIEVNGITILEQFYQDVNKYAFSFEMLVSLSKFEILKKTINNNPNSLIICERSLLTDKYIFMNMLYNSRNIDPYSYKIYNLWFKNIYTDLPDHKYIYLKSQPDIIKLKIDKRNRDGESKIDINYLSKCDYYHSKFINNNIKNLLVTIEMDSIELFSNDLNDSLNEEYKIMLDDVIRIILNYNNKVYECENIIENQNNILIYVIVIFIILYLLYLYITS
jgi:deoxyadenosine/deoxycytidine kinase